MQVALTGLRRKQRIWRIRNGEHRSIIHDQPLAHSSAESEEDENDQDGLKNQSSSSCFKHTVRTAHEVNKYSEDMQSCMSSFP